MKFLKHSIGHNITIIGHEHIYSNNNFGSDQ